jgi:N-acetylglutamate synthase-like GNAT family acetyltransferase
MKWNNKMQIIDLKYDQDSLPILARWHQDEWYFLEPTKTLQDRMARIKLCFEDSFVPSIYIAKENNTLLGSAAIIEHDMDTRKDLSPWLAGVYVPENYRKRGIGSKLVLYVMQQAKKNGFKTLYLYTLKHSDFYSKLGWTVIQETEYRNCQITIMSIDLNSKLLENSSINK